MRLRIAVFAWLVGVAVLPGCFVTWERRAGVENKWRADATHFEVGKTRQQAVLDALGPPSQVIALGNRTVFYYLLEGATSEDIVLIWYNKGRETVMYDRAMFVFDEQGVLSEQALSLESLPYEEAEGGS